jgi:protoporphyrinogen/coproporphyrinogen III oxidase
MRVLVVGAGIAGLGAATLFASRGHSVEVIEADERVGGRAVTVTSKHRRRIDAGTQYFHTNYRIARRLLRDLGLERDLTRIKGNTRFFDDRVSRGAFEVSHRLPWFPPAGLSNLRSAGLLVQIGWIHGGSALERDEGGESTRIVVPPFLGTLRGIAHFNWGLIAPDA